MSNVTQIVTNYAVPTGDFVREWLEENELSQADLARAMGVSAKHVSKLLAGASLSPDVALKLELVTGIPARIWLQQEATYRADVARLGLEESLVGEKELAKEFPVSELRKMGVLSSTMLRPGVVLMELMAFFGVGSLDGLRTRTQPVPAFRQDQAHPVKPGSVQAWLRLIELELKSQDPLSVPYDEEKFRALLPQIRALSVSPPEHFGAKLVEMLADVGVRLLYVKEVPGVRAHGCTQWYDGNPVITLTLRGKDDGKFWFTAFHEFGHVLLHPRNEVMIQADAEPATAAEGEADQFARDSLIPPTVLPALRALKSKSEIRRFASQIGTCPGVVVGRLHHEKLWPHSHGADLYLRMSIVDE
jgi:HTH-type transcriptional regulator/antitoxin HigA